MAKRKTKQLPIIGWREWVGLPDFGVPSIKAKVDSGARSSSLHAFGLKQFERDGTAFVRFQIHPVQRKTVGAVKVEAEVLEFRSIRTSSGKAELRPVVVTTLTLLGQTWPIELTLAGRDEMGFRMLLGRQAFRKRFLVDAARSFCGGKPESRNRPAPESDAIHDDEFEPA